jgi:DNA-binding CsgD family transcriptional regulator
VVSVSLFDANACRRTLGECQELWDDPGAWQERLAAGIEELIGGFGGAFKYYSVSPSDLGQLEEAALGVQNDESMRSDFARCVEEGGHWLLPEFNRLGMQIVLEGQASCRYSDLPGGLERYHRSEFYQRYLRPSGTGDMLIAGQRQVDGGVITLVLLRGRSDRHFSSRDEAVVRLLNMGIGEVVGTRLVTSSQFGRHRLSPRLRQTLTLLLSGLREKEIAAKLDLHPTTVHDYVRAVYRAYRVHGRAELMALFLTRRVRHR